MTFVTPGENFLARDEFDLAAVPHRQDFFHHGATTRLFVERPERPFAGGSLQPVEPRPMALFCMSGDA
jgi:hypothetical protein